MFRGKIGYKRVIVLFFSCFLWGFSFEVDWVVISFAFPFISILLMNDDGICVVFTFVFLSAVVFCLRCFFVNGGEKVLAGWMDETDVKGARNTRDGGAAKETWRGLDSARCLLGLDRWMMNWMIAGFTWVLVAGIYGEFLGTGYWKCRDHGCNWPGFGRDGRMDKWH